MAKRLVPLSGDSPMFGASWLPEAGLGTDLASLGYREQEYRFSGVADLYRHDEQWRPTRARTAVPFATRVVVRWPAAEGAFSGTVHLEPLHPDADGAHTWRALHPYLMRSGHAHVGVGVFAGVTALLQEQVDPQRYGSLSLAEDGLGYDIVSRLARLLCSPEGTVLVGRPVERIFLSGWSMTSSFCRVFMNEGFHERYDLKLWITHSLEGAAYLPR